MSRITLTLSAAAAALLIAACSSSPATTSTPPASNPPAAAPTTHAPTSAPAVSTGLTGKWSGQYSGSYNGTFTLHWRQSGNNLIGTIKISNPLSTLPIHGMLNGNAIKFGTVGSVAITYTGTVSGNSMSGTYQVGTNAGGPWSASKG